MCHTINNVIWKRLSVVQETMSIPVKLGEQFVAVYREQGGTGHVSSNMYGVCYFDKNGKAKVPYGRILIRKVGM